MFHLMEQQQLHDCHFFRDSHTGLEAIIAIHSTARGPALGGCRFLSYPNAESATTDAMRLARGMSYKAALADIPFGGGKAVILRPDRPFNREALMLSFANCINSMAGRYITAVDSGTDPADMDIIARRSQYSSSGSLDGSPAPHTATGVIAGMRACLKHRLGHADFSRTHIALQGLGNVGLPIAEQLTAAGARLTVADIDANKAQDFAAQHANIEVVAAAEIHRSHCDIFSPCALGAVINEQTLPELNCRIIAGSANNQLAEPQHGDLLHQQGILYAPDYAINAGGVIYIGLHRHHLSLTEIERKIQAIETTLGDIFQQSEHSQTAPHRIADRLAEAKIHLTPAGAHAPLHSTGPCSDAQGGQHAPSH